MDRIRRFDVHRRERERIVVGLTYEDVGLVGLHIAWLRYTLSYIDHQFCKGFARGYFAFGGCLYLVSIIILGDVCKEYFWFSLNMCFASSY